MSDITPLLGGYNAAFKAVSQLNISVNSPPANESIFDTYYQHLSLSYTVSPAVTTDLHVGVNEVSSGTTVFPYQAFTSGFDFTPNNADTCPIGYPV